MLDKSEKHGLDGMDRSNTFTVVNDQVVGSYWHSRMKEAQGGSKRLMKIFRQAERVCVIIPFDSTANGTYNMLAVRNNDTRMQS